MSATELGNHHMHYGNGREAKNGDKIIYLPPQGSPVVGMLYDATPGNDYCNGRVAVMTPSDLWPNLKDCLHIDDINAVLAAGVPDSSKPAPGASAGEPEKPTEVPPVTQPGN